MDPALLYAFVDFKPFVAAHPEDKTSFALNGLGHASQKGIWTRVFDGVLYIKDMYPCEPIFK